LSEENFDETVEKVKRWLENPEGEKLEEKKPEEEKIEEDKNKATENTEDTEQKEREN